MPIRLKCANGHALLAPDRLSGRKVACPKCRAPVLVPAQGDSPKPNPVRRKKPAPSSSKPTAGRAKSSVSGVDNASPRASDDDLPDLPDDDFMDPADDFDDEAVGTKPAALPPRRSHQQAALRARREARVREAEEAERMFEPSADPQPQGRRKLLIAGAAGGGLVAIVVVVALVLSSDSEPEAADSAEPSVAETVSETPQQPDGATDGSAAAGGDPATAPPDQPAAREPIVQRALVRSPLEYPLDFVVVDLAVGGRGRWLILQFEGRKELAVFDVNTGRIAGDVPVEQTEIHFTAGLDKLLVFIPETGHLQRWDLATRTLEKSEPLPDVKQFRAIGMGPDSAGPAIFIYDDTGLGHMWKQLDPDTFATWGLGYRPQHRYGTQVAVRAAPGGQLFTAWDRESGPTLEIVQPAVRSTLIRKPVGHAVPGQNGEYVFTGAGIFLGKKPQRDNPAEPAGMYFVPAHHGTSFLGIPVDPVGLNLPIQLPARLYQSMDSGPVAILHDLEFERLTSIDGLATTKLTLDRRVHLIPDADLIVTLPSGEDRLALHQVDFDAEPQQGAAHPKHHPITRSTIDLGKQISVLVVLPEAKGFGSAFCIDGEHGDFATNEHVISDVGLNGEVTLVLNAGEPSQRIIAAKVVRIDAQADLALLRTTQPPTGLTAVELGVDHDVEKGMDLAAFGYPFGDALAVRNQQYPNISINKGTVSSLRTESLGRLGIELDTQLNPGNSGGPVLNGAGKLVGVVRSTIIAGGLSYVIPVGDLKDLLEAFHSDGSSK